MFLFAIAFFPAGGSVGLLGIASASVRIPPGARSTPTYSSGPIHHNVASEDPALVLCIRQQCLYCEKIAFSSCFFLLTTVFFLLSELTERDHPCY
jgi:hypothetical protein